MYDLIKKFLLNQPHTVKNPGKLKIGAVCLAKPHVIRVATGLPSMAILPLADYYMVDDDKKKASTLRTGAKATIGCASGVGVRWGVDRLVHFCTETPLKIAEDATTIAEKPWFVKIEEKIHKSLEYLQKPTKIALNMLFEKLPNNVQDWARKQKPKLSQCALPTDPIFKKTFEEYLQEYMADHPNVSEEKAIKQAKKTIEHKITLLERYRSLLSGGLSLVIMAFITNYLFDVKLTNFVTKKLLHGRTPKPNPNFTSINTPQSITLSPAEKIKLAFDEFELSMKKKSMKGGGLL